MSLNKLKLKATLPNSDAIKYQTKRGEKFLIGLLSLLGYEPAFGAISSVFFLFMTKFSSNLSLVVCQSFFLLSSNSVASLGIF